MAKKRGRKDKLTPEVQQKLIEAIKEGNYYEAACAYAGISYQTFLNWLERGKREKSGKFFEFFEAVTRAEAEAERKIVKMWIEAIPEDWRAARDFLERRYPDRWGKKDHLNLSGDVGVKITIVKAKKRKKEKNG